MPAASKDALIRIITMMQLIPIYPRWVTAKQLHQSLDAKGFSVSRRTVERNLSHFSTVFGLVSSESPEGNKWSYAKDSSLVFLPAMSPAEALSFKLVEDNLAFTLPRNSLKGLEGIFKKANDILKRDRLYSQWHEKVRLVPPGLNIKTTEVDEDILNTLYTGLFNNVEIAIKYTNSTAYHNIKPLGLIVRNNKLVVPCKFATFEDVRLILAHRIKEAKLINISFNETFDLSEYIASQAPGHFVSKGEIELTLHTRDYATMLLSESHIGKNQRLSKIDEVWSELNVLITHTKELEHFLKSNIHNIKIIAPLSLREQIIKDLMQGLAYQKDE